MCSPAALGAVQGGSSVLSGGLGVYNAYQQANLLRQQAGLYETQSGIYGLQADAFDQQASFAGAQGRYQGALERIRAGQVQTQAEQNQVEAAKAAQQVVGEGKTAFAANGILLEGRAGSAPAMWEQDEAASLAWEQGLIKTNADNEVFGYLANAKMAEAQGRAQANAYRYQGIGARLNAQSSLMQAGMSRAQGRTAIINGWAGLIGSVGQGAGQYFSTAGFGGGKAPAKAPA